MPKLTNSAPSYRRHKATGQAIVTLAGRDHYLGKYGSASSRTEYDRLIGEWLAAGRPATIAVRYDLTMAELMIAYLKWAMGHYGDSSELVCVKAVLRRIKKLYAKTPAIDFGPLALKAIRQGMIDDGLARSTINANIGRIRRMFRWGASEELIPSATYQALTTVSGLQKNRTAAKETEPVLPVEDKVVSATIPHMPPMVADMVRIQRLTGMRPAEVCLLRPVDIDRSGEVWEFKPHQHKTKYRGRNRVIFIGPRAQAILLPYLLRESTAFCFSPSESEKKRREENHANRATPMNCGNRPGSRNRRGKKVKRTAGACYDTNSYRRAIHRACDRAFPPAVKLMREELDAWQSDHRWSPNQLRHTAATDVRRHAGIEAAQVVLGHSKADVTQIYAERDLQLARKVMAEVG